MEKGNHHLRIITVVAIKVQAAVEVCSKTWAPPQGILHKTPINYKGGKGEFQAEKPDAAI